MKYHDDVIKWKHFCRVTGPLCGEFILHMWIPLAKASDAEVWCFLICAWINSSVNNRDAGDLRHHCTNYDVPVMMQRMCQMYLFHFLSIVYGFVNLALWVTAWGPLRLCYVRLLPFKYGSYILNYATVRCLTPTAGTTYIPSSVTR